MDDVVGAGSGALSAGIFHDNWLFFIIYGLVMFLLTAFGAYYGAYFKTTGDNEALNAKIKDLLARLEATTKLEASVKTEVADRSWAKKEELTVKRDRLEKIIFGIYELRKWHDEQYRAALKGESPSNVRDISTLFAYVALYFPRFKGLLNSLQEVSRTVHYCLLDVAALSRQCHEIKEADKTPDMELAKKLKDLLEHHARLQAELDKHQTKFMDAAHDLLQGDLSYESLEPYPPVEATPPGRGENR